LRIQRASAQRKLFLEEQEICCETILLQLPFSVSEIIQNGDTKKIPMQYTFNMLYEVLRSGNQNLQTKE